MRAGSQDKEMLASMAPDELRLWLEGKVGVPRPVAMLLRMLIAAQRRVY